MPTGVFRISLDDEDLLPFAVESLEVNLLQVRLAESGLTFTTVINSRTDPELASEIQSEVARHRNRWLPLRSKLNAVDAAIQEFQKTVAQRVGTDSGGVQPSERNGGRHAAHVFRVGGA